MDDAKHVKTLKKSVGAWNKWKAEKPEEINDRME